MLAVADVSTYVVSLTRHMSDSPAENCAEKNAHKDAKIVQKL